MGRRRRVVDYNGLHRAAAIVGVGSTPYGTLTGYSADELAGWALLDATRDAGLTISDIDGLITVRVSSYENIAVQYGIQPRWVCQLPPEGRMTGVAMELVTMAI